MNHNEDNGGPLLMFGGVLTVLGLGAVVMKALKTFFHELSESFEAFGQAVAAFFPMLFRILAIVGTIAAIVLVAVAGVYFSYRYVKLVRRATELQEHVDTELANLRSELDAQWKGEVSELARRLVNMQRKLVELMQPPTPMAPVQEIKATSDSPAISVRAANAQNKNPVADSEDEEDAALADEATEGEPATIQASQSYRGDSHRAQSH